MVEMAARAVYSERKGPGATPVTFIYQPSSSAFLPHLEQDERFQAGRLRQRAGQWVRDVFLPQGYPESVSPDYLHYQFWDSLQAYCSSIAGALSLQATLVGLGVGEGSATPLAATLSWLLKDGSGMVASIAFAYWRGSQLDCNSKQWRLFADVMNNLALFLRLLGPLLPVPFLFVLCLSAVITALVGVAGGSTRTALAAHQARSNNMADVSAKDGSQETIVNLAALLTNLTLLPLITASLGLTWATFVVCVCLHLYTNYRAMRAITMESLNRPRLLLTLHHWVTSSSIPSTQAANLSEPLFWGPAFIPNYFPHGFCTAVGCSLHWALQRCGGENSEAVYKAAADTFKHENYLLCGNLRRRQLHVVYRPSISVREELEALFTAYLCVANYVHQTEGAVLSGEYVASGLSCTTTDYQLMSAVKTLAQRIFPHFMKGLQEKGWEVDELLLGADEWRLLTRAD